MMRDIVGETNERMSNKATSSSPSPSMFVPSDVVRLIRHLLPFGTCSTCSVFFVDEQTMLSGHTEKHESQKQQASSTTTLSFLEASSAQ